MRIETECRVCKKSLVRYANTADKRFFCSRLCYAKWQSENQCGENNSNFGNRWSEEARKKHSEVQSALMTPERRALIGDQHRGKVESEETRKNKSESHKARLNGRAPYVMTDEIRANIGRASAAKFTVEYKKKDRARREALGLVVPLEQKDDYLFYRELSDWVERMFDRVTDELQLTILQERGVFNNRTNTEGVVRDHVFSRWSGFQQGVFPELLRHPCNLQLITHGENVGKAQRAQKDGQTLEQLFSKIRAYSLEWSEQTLCLRLIEDFESGKRYEKTKYIERYYEDQNKERNLSRK